MSLNFSLATCVPIALERRLNLNGKEVFLEFIIIILAYFGLDRNLTHRECPHELFLLIKVEGYPTRMFCITMLNPGARESGPSAVRRGT